ncbi:MAG: hypothetical protein H6721_16015 [Sandaracinus sp.]|nr:hypothetical protein [Sandaracinus sp.]MCB9633623.1 hypothetical protein [Sandaracinus sp.]
MSIVDAVLSVWSSCEAMTILGGRNVEDLLDERDEEAFEVPWLLAWERVKRASGSSRPKGLASDEEQRLFRSLYDQGLGGELVEHVAEDLNLIAAAERWGLTDDAWIDALRRAYLAGHFPSRVDATR